MAVPSTGIFILIVAADPAIRDATELLLKVEGYSAASVATLDAALQYFQAGNRVDLLMSEYRLGHDESGIHVIATIRSVVQKALPAILVTEEASAELQQLCRFHGLWMVSKPFMAEQLLLMLRALS